MLAYAFDVRGHTSSILGYISASTGCHWFLHVELLLCSPFILTLWCFSGLTLRCRWVPNIRVFSFHLLLLRLLHIYLVVHILTSERVSFVARAWWIILIPLVWIEVHVIILLRRHVMILKRSKTSKSVELRNLTLFLRFNLYVLVRCYYVHRHMLVVIHFLCGKRLLLMVARHHILVLNHLLLVVALVHRWTFLPLYQRLPLIEEARLRLFNGSLVLRL